MLPVLYEIMDLVKAYDAVLCTGHVSAAEADLIIRNGLDYGCRMMLTHPEILFIQMPAEAQKELAQKGAYIEKCWLNVFTGQSARTKCAGTSHTLVPDNVFSLRIWDRQIILCPWKMRALSLSEEKRSGRSVIFICSKRLSQKRNWKSYGHTGYDWT